MNAKIRLRMTIKLKMRDIPRTGASSDTELLSLELAELNERFRSSSLLEKCRVLLCACFNNFHLETVEFILLVANLSCETGEF